MTELFRALGVLIEPPEASQAEEMLRIARLLDLAEARADLPSAEDYTELFLFQLYPYASVYLGAEGMMGGEARDRIAGFLRTLGGVPPAEADHLSFLLAAYAGLAAPDDSLDPKESEAKRQRARKAFVWEHLLCWLPAWLRTLHRLRPPRFYDGWANLLEEALRHEAASLGPPETLPAHLREAPAIANPNCDGAEAFLQSLLAPARSGLVLVRTDLCRAAETLGLGLRAGERRYVLEHLLGQDSGAVLTWLADEASSWSEYWQEQPWLGAVADFWAERAASTAAVLADSTP